MGRFFHIVGSGDEGFVFKEGDRVLKIHHPIPLKSVLDEDTAIKFWEMNQFKEGNVMILFKDPQSCLRVLERGLKVPFINLGIMPKTNDKVMLVAGTFVNEEDMSCIRQIHDLNISVFAQLTPDLKKTEYSDLIQIYGKK